MRAKNPFSTITSSGMLLPIDLLVRIADGDANLPGLTPDAYHLRSGERLNEAASRAWTQCKAAWDAYRRKWQTLSASDTGTTLTRNEWLLPLFQELGYGRLQPKSAVVIDEKSYPVSHRWEEHVPIHLLSARYSLDKRYPGVEGAATRSPYSMVQELLNRTGKFRWGMVSNGLKLYLLRDNNSLSRAANVEFDLECMMDGEVYADFMLLWLLCHQSRVEILSTGAGCRVSGVGEIAEPQGAGKKTKGKAGGKTPKSSSRKTQRALIDEADDDDTDSESDEEELLDDDSSDEVASSVIPPAPETRNPTPDSCWLERWTKEAETRGTRAREKLRSGVENAINALGAGFLETRGNEDLKHRLATGALDKQDFYRQLLRMVYRLLLLLVAEEKKDEHGQNLLHPLGIPSSVRQRYAKFYSVGRLRDLAGLRRGTSHTDLFESLKILFEKLREGYEPLGIPGLGSFLFSTTATPDLDDSHLSNVAVLDCFRQLGYTDDDAKSRRLVDFGNLGSEELGSVYESLLELHPRINSDKGPFILDSAAGSERKTTGSYYTPTSLINCLLDSALDPVIEAAIKGGVSGVGGQVSGKTHSVASATSPSPAIPPETRNPEPETSAEQRLLALKICDPACGSGHFLIAAAERLALHLARIRTGDDQPSSMDVQHAKRDVIGRCIYGVDLNPMAVELCKVSLWMEALDPGRPLSFLDHHIQCGNSLLGTTPALLEQGIPDDAFNPIEGDVKAVCSELKKTNKRERSDREKGQGYLFEPFIKLGNLPTEFTRLSSSRDESVADIAEKERLYAELVKGADYQNARLLADTWCAVFVWHKDTSDLGKLCPTERDYRKIENNPHSILPHVKSEVRHLAEQYHFFHWHLAFPDVFRLPAQGTKAENKQTGWDRGFDVILGNPPWERTFIQEKEYFAQVDPKIANATSKMRRKLIADLVNSDPATFGRWTSYCREQQGEKELMRGTGAFPLSTINKFNIYAVFAERAIQINAANGRLGLIVPSGITSDHMTRFLFGFLLENDRLISAYDIENANALFPIHRGFRFTLMAASGSNLNSAPVFGFRLTDVAQLSDASRVFPLSREEIVRLNPESKNCPSFSRRTDAILVLAIHKRFPPFGDKENEDGRWRVDAKVMFNLTNDTQHFVDLEEVASDVPVARDGEPLCRLIEAKMFHQFDHRFAGISVNDKNLHRKSTSTNTDIDHYRDPTYVPLPRYFVRKSTLSARAGDSHWRVVYRNITDATTNARTGLFAVVPAEGIGHTGTVLDVSVEHCAQESAILLAGLNSFIVDYTLRQKVTSTHLLAFVLRQLPLLPPRAVPDEFPSGHTFSHFVTHRVLELTYTAWDLEAFALDCGYDGPPFRWDEERRFLLRCELDAAYFHLYLGSPAEWGKEPEEVPGVGGQVSGESQLARNPKPETRNPSALAEMFPTPRDAVAYIMETFPIVKRKDIKRTTITDENGTITQPGTYITKDTILAIYDEMQTAINTGHPYQTRLDPHPGPPTDDSGNFIPMEDWRGQPGHIHPPRLVRHQVEQGRLVLDLLLLLEAWKQPVSITALEPALLLMRNNAARKALLDYDLTQSESSELRSKPHLITGIDRVYAAVEVNGAIRRVGENGYELAKPELLNDASKTDRSRATEVIQAVSRLSDLRMLPEVVAELTEERYEVTV